jgi:acyl-coenzyme A synthetase/AMP-(fatty) acid ligase
MPRRSHATVIALACRDPAAFLRGHLHALWLDALSVMIPQHDHRILAAVAERYPGMMVCTDHPDDPSLSPFEVIDVRVLTRWHDLPRKVAADRVVAVLCTSGSTGDAKFVPITYGRFAGESRALTQLFWDDTAPIRVVTTVPFEHMYGYQFGFFWPRFACLEAPETRVVLPADLRAALTRSSRPTWLVTTPTHLSAFAEAGLHATNVARVFSATGPLSPRHAEGARRSFGVWPIDIYGSTETGTIGWREYDGTDRPWQCIPGKQLRTREDGSIELRGPDFAAAEPIADLLELTSPQRFRILGRAAHLLKVAGKRASLGALDAALLAAPGVRDGAYWLPDEPQEQASVARPVAFVVLADGATPAQVMAHLRSCVDPVFLPRPLFAVDDLGRNAVGKLPLATLRGLHASCRARREAVGKIPVAASHQWEEAIPS